MKTIGIIGAGFCGAMTAIHLLSQNKLDYRVVLIDPCAYAGRGIAYGVESNAFLLNVHADSMGAYSDRPEDFFSWIKQNQLPYAANDFVPRKIYGDYLEFLLDQEKDSSDRIEFIRSSVVQISKESDGWNIFLENGSNIIVNAAVLAIGFSRQNFSFLNPHAESSYEGIEHCKKIAIIGSGLTAIDVFEKCRSLDFKGDFTVISRSGKFPYVHGSTAEAVVELKVAKLLQGGQPALRILIDCIRSDIQKYGPEVVLNHLRPDLVKLWQGFSLKERKQFFLHLESRWNRIRHRMPQSSANTIASLKEAGKLKIISAYFKKCEFLNSSSYEVFYNDKLGLHSLEVDKAFDCRGPSGSIENNSLIKNLLQNEIVKPTELMRGIRTNSSGRATEYPQPPLYVVGPLRREELLEATAVRELRQHAADASAALARDLNN